MAHSQQRQEKRPPTVLRCKRNLEEHFVNLGNLVVCWTATSSGNSQTLETKLQADYCLWTTTCIAFFSEGTKLRIVSKRCCMCWAVTRYEAFLVNLPSSKLNHISLGTKNHSGDYLTRKQRRLGDQTSRFQGHVPVSVPACPGKREQNKVVTRQAENKA